MARGGFPGGMGGGNMQQLMQKAQRMQQEMQKAQAELLEREFSASSGGGMVNVTMLGNKQLKSIAISPECVDPEDVDMLQDLVLSAVNAASQTVDAETEAVMSKFTGGMGLGF